MTNIADRESWVDARQMIQHARDMISSSIGCVFILIGKLGQQTQKHTRAHTYEYYRSHINVLSRSGNKDDLLTNSDGPPAVSLAEIHDYATRYRIMIATHFTVLAS